MISKCEIFDAQGTNRTGNFLSMERVKWIILLLRWRPSETFIMDENNKISHPLVGIRQPITELRGARRE